MTSTTLKLGLGMTSVQTAKPDYSYGSALPQVPIQASASLALLRASIPTSIPKTAVITSAKIWLNQYDGPWAGSVTLTALRHVAAYTYQTTWNSKPGATTTGSQTRVNAPDDSWWSIDVATDVQAFVAGTLTNYGWRLATSSATLHKLRSQEAAASQPYLEITYEVVPQVPTSLSPQGGAVSVAKPVLTFNAGPGVTSIQVQIDPAANGVAPGFDSGTVVATAGVLDLALATPGGTYAGLSNAATTFWRARSLTSLGWSAYSSWVSFSRQNLAGVTLTSPTAAPADGTPPFTWTVAGATQTAWQATLLDANLKVLSDSGVVPGTALVWTPSKGLSANGQTGFARIRSWDDVTPRIATPGVLPYNEQTVALTLTMSGAVTAMTTLTQTQTEHVPGVHLAGTRANIPDEVVVLRDGVAIARLVGTDVFTGTAFAWTDYTVPMNRQVTYRVAPVVNGAAASGGPTVDVTPACDGLWLVDPDTGGMAVLWGARPGSYEQTDLAVLHRPIAPGAVPVRRRLRRGSFQGTQSGDIIDALTFDAYDTITALDVTFPGNDAGTVYRLVDGHKNLAVIAGDFRVDPTPESSTDVVAVGSFWFCEV